MKTVSVSLAHPDVREMLQEYQGAWGINPETFVAPKRWVGRVDDDGRVQAAMGYTTTPDSSYVMIAELLCRPNRRGIREMKNLIGEFSEKAFDGGKVQLVCSFTNYTNTPMRKFVERCGMKPISVVYDITREQYRNWRHNGK